MSVDKKISLFGKKATDDSVPAPGAPPTWDENGVLIDAGNPWIGPMNNKVGYPTEGYSQKQLRRVVRAQKRRQAAEVRVASRAYSKGELRRSQFNAFIEQRGRILRGEVRVSPQVMDNLVTDNRRRQGVTRSFDTLAQRQDVAEDRRDDRLDARRIARFKAGKPRGKDLREDVMKQYSSFLPPTYWARKGERA